MMKKQIKSVNQITEEMRHSKKELDNLINYLNIPPLTMEEDLEKRTPTIEQILRDLPSDQRLKEMLEHPFAETPQIRQRILSNYKGKYDIVRRAAENIKSLKFQAQKLYYLAAELNLYKIKNEFEGEAQLDIKLKSYEITKNENNRLPKFEKNTISVNYLKDLKQEELKTSLHTNTSEFLQMGESLLHINLYDSINGEKIFEYVAYGDQTLLDIVGKFYCLIARLEGKETMHHLNSYCLIEDNFYYYGNLAKKKIEDIIAFSTQNMDEDFATEHLPHNNLVYEMAKTKIKNLRVVFGRPYLYRHLEGCDHIIIFKDLRILTENQTNDPILKDKYPLAVFQGRLRRRKCDGCRGKYADVVSLNDPLKSGKHLYICNACHQNLHPQEQKDNHMFIKYIHD